MHEVGLQLSGGNYADLHGRWSLACVLSVYEILMCVTDLFLWKLSANDIYFMQEAAYHDARCFVRIQ